MKNIDTPKPRDHTIKIFWSVFEGLRDLKCLRVSRLVRVFEGVRRGFKFGYYGNGFNVVLVCQYCTIAY